MSRISPASRLRRRMIALTALLLGSVLVATRHWNVGPVESLAVATAAVLYGAVGLVLPAAVHDFVRPEFGHLQLWMESGRWETWIGFAALFVGFAAGIVWIILGG